MYRDLGQPTDGNIFTLCKALNPLLLDIPYDRLNGTNSLVGIINDAADYTLEYGAVFPVPVRVGVYDTTIKKDATPGERREVEAKHKAKL